MDHMRISDIDSSVIHSQTKYCIKKTLKYDPENLIWKGIRVIILFDLFTCIMQCWALHSMLIQSAFSNYTRHVTFVPFSVHSTQCLLFWIRFHIDFIATAFLPSAIVLLCILHLSILLAKFSSCNALWHSRTFCHYYSSLCEPDQKLIRRLVLV